MRRIRGSDVGVLPLALLVFGIGAAGASGGPRAYAEVITDEAAIAWGYRLVPDAESPEATKRVLREWLEERADDPMYRFGDPSNMDPGASSEALGDDAVQASEVGIANLKRIVPALLEWTFEERYEALLDQWRLYTSHVILLVGEVDWTRRAQGQDGRPYDPTPADRQRDALGYLEREVFETPEWHVDPEILYHIEASGIQDRIRALQVAALGQLLGVARL